MSSTSKMNGALGGDDTAGPPFAIAQLPEESSGDALHHAYFPKTT